MKSTRPKIKRPVKSRVYYTHWDEKHPLPEATDYPDVLQWPRLIDHLCVVQKSMICLLMNKQIITDQAGLAMIQMLSTLDTGNKNDAL